MAAANIHRTVEEVFEDYKGRRNGLIKALTTDVEEFYWLCSPEKQNLCLYGFPSGRWEVNLPVEDVPSELPEPALGINFARDGMPKNDWLSMVAIHSDSWLLSVSSYFGAAFGFNKTDRNRLFNKINNLPTLFEVVAKKQTKVTNHKRKNKNTKREEEDDKRIDDDAFERWRSGICCPICGKNYVLGDYWISCIVCEKRYHGMCLRRTNAGPRYMESFECAMCTSTRKKLPPW